MLHEKLEKLKIIFKKLSKRVMSKRFLFMALMTIGFIALKSSVAFAVPNDVQAFLQDSSFQEVERFINYMTWILRGFVGAVCGLVVTNSGLKVAAEENAEGMREGKKVAHKIFWSLLLTFGGSSAAKAIARKVLLGI